ncbi:MAG: DNA polymerase Y family protein [Trichloromonadaceae bacterium]
MRDILHFSIPDFPIAVARVIDVSLRARPLAVVPGNSGRALLQAVSAEARAEGVREGMPVYRAQRCCPALRLITPEPARVSRAMQALVELSCGYTPLWEPEQGGQLYLDLTGSGRLFGPGRDVAARIEKEVAARLRLQGAVGVAGNKLVSRIAAHYLRRPGVCDVLRGSEAGFIGPLAVSVLPGIGATRAELLLLELNLRRVEELAALSMPQLRLVFGGFAPLARQRALGVDPSPVQPPRRRPEVAEEAFLAAEENDDEVLLAELCRLVESCGLRLRQLGQGARQLVFSLHYADGVSERRTAALPVSENQDVALLVAAEGLFFQACQRRVRVKGMRLVCRQLGESNPQMDLFGIVGQTVSARDEALQGALDALRGRHGMGVVVRGKGFVG